MNGTKNNLVGPTPNINSKKYEIYKNLRQFFLIIKTHKLQPQRHENNFKANFFTAIMTPSDKLK